MEREGDGGDVRYAIEECAAFRRVVAQEAQEIVGDLGMIALLRPYGEAQQVADLELTSRDPLRLRRG